MTPLNFRTNSIGLVATLALSAFLLACPSNDEGLDDGASSETGEACTPAEQGCACNEGQCLPGLECMGDICMDPECEPGTQLCGCSEGGMCFGDLQCIEGVCKSSGGGECVPNDHYQCADGAIHWFDSCGGVGEISKKVCFGGPSRTGAMLRLSTVSSTAPGAMGCSIHTMSAMAMRIRGT